MKLILFFLFSFSVFANYIPEQSVGDPDFSGPVFLQMNDCQSHYQETCIEVPVGYSKDFHRVSNSKTGAEACLDNDDCQLKLSQKQCENEENAIMVLDSEPKEVYCTSKKVRVNSALKTAFETSKNNLALQEKSEKNEIKLLKQKLKSENLTQAELMKVIKFLVKNIN